VDDRLTAMSSTAAYRIVVLLLWALAAWATVTCRGLFWDGSSFLVNMLDEGWFHDFYVARAHVDRVTQAPVLLLSKLGAHDTRLLAMVYSATLFGLPVALYHFALARVRHDAVLLAIVIAIVVVVYLPTSFFIIGEYNVTYAAAAACMAVVVTRRDLSLGDAAFLVVLGVLSVRSYEAMAYLGPLLAAAIAWSLRATGDWRARMLGAIAVLAFVAACVVSLATIAEYWSHPHFVKVRSMSLDFWQNLQFAIPLAALAICGVIGLIRPSWLRGRGPLIVVGIATAALALTPWYRLLDPDSILYPPAHYLARQAAGLMLALLLAGLWLHAAWKERAPAALTTLRLPAVSGRMVAAMTVLVFAGAIPDVALTSLWSDYLARMRTLVDSREGIIRGYRLPQLDWPEKLFSQDWTLPAMSALVSRTPGRSFVRADNDYLSNPPFDPACGTLPKLKGYGWGR
jgi:hypothetical protein